jgi:hypothetical protein
LSDPAKKRRYDNFFSGIGSSAATYQSTSSHYYPENINEIIQTELERIRVELQEIRETKRVNAELEKKIDEIKKETAEKIAENNKMMEEIRSGKRTQVEKTKNESSSPLGLPE